MMSLKDWGNGEKNLEDEFRDPANPNLDIKNMEIRIITYQPFVESKG